MAPSNNIQFGIYCWKNKVTGRVLVGQTGSTVGFEKRRKRYLSELKAGRWANSYFQRSWDKHGPQNFEFAILEVVAEDSMLTVREQFYIDFFRSNPEGVYNWAGPADAPRRGAKNSPEHIRKVAEANRGQRRGPLDPAHVKKISEANRGKRRSQEARENISKGKKGKGFSEQHKANLSARRKELMKSQEFRQIFKDSAHKRPVVSIDKETGAITEYESISEAARQGYIKGHIIKCLKGERKTHGGKIWRDKE